MSDSSKPFVPKKFLESKAGGWPVSIRVKVRRTEPGALYDGPGQREFCCTWPNQTEVTVRGIHLVQEGSPIGIGAAVAEFRADPSSPIAGQVES